MDNVIVVRNFILRVYDFILHEQQYLLYFVHTALADQKGEIRSTMDVLCISPKVSGMGTTLLTWERLYFRSTPSVHEE